MDDRNETYGGVRTHAHTHMCARAVTHTHTQRHILVEFEAHNGWKLEMKKSLAISETYKSIMVIQGCSVLKPSRVIRIQPERLFHTNTRFRKAESNIEQSKTGDGFPLPSSRKINLNKSVARIKTYISKRLRLFVILVRMNVSTKHTYVHAVYYCHCAFFS